MAIKATTNSRKLVPAGNYLVAIVGIYDLGTQPSRDATMGPAHQVMITFELHKRKGICRDDDNRPLLYTRRYALRTGVNKQSKQPSALRQLIEAAIGKGLTADQAKDYDVTQLIDLELRISIGLTEDKSSDMISAYSPIDEDDPQLEVETSSFVYELDPGGDIPKEVPDWIATVIRQCQEWPKGEAAASPRRGGGKPSDEDDEPAPRNRRRAAAPADDDEPAPPKRGRPAADEDDEPPASTPPKRQRTAGAHAGRGAPPAGDDPDNPF